jgi:hypothetical protein
LGEIRVQAPAGFASETGWITPFSLTSEGSFSMAVGLTGPGASGFQRWLVTEGVPLSSRGPYSDPDADGMNNLLEFLMATSPILPSQEAQPRVSVFRSRNSVAAGFVVRRSRVAATEATFFLEASQDLKIWERVEPVVTMVSPGENWDVVRLLDPSPMNPKGARFLRLGVGLIE